MEELVAKSLGEKGFRDLVAAFYRRVREDEVIGPMYPEDDWEGSEKRLRDFLLFRFGLSQAYIEERGHPRLRMRHMPFRIGETERDQWLARMGEAMDDIELTGPPREALEQFFAQVADFMRNQAG
ncbi:MAG: globin [Verrucomicrobiales bacterium]|nr:globin [Verrucomicrobiales bacterium]